MTLKCRHYTRATARCSRYKSIKLHLSATSHSLRSCKLGLTAFKQLDSGLQAQQHTLVRALARGEMGVRKVDQLDDVGFGVWFLALRL